MTTRSPQLLAMLFCASLSAAACGGGSDSTDPTPAPAPSPGAPAPSPGAGSPSPAPAPSPAPVPAPAPTPSPVEPQLAAPVALPVTVGERFWPEGSTSSGGQGQPMMGMDCGSVNHENTNYHVHSHLNIFIDGRQVAVPGNAGVVPNRCHYQVHTHDSTGLVHVEALASGRFTLGQFFGVWGQPLSASNVAGQTGKPIAFYLDDGRTLQRYTGDPAEIELSSHRGITIVIGTPPAQIPTYLWPGA